ncbi:MAG: hypothetical protein KAJ07_07760 [Planctomycetes bacterium]|nr:hypothetical protein [Planctomycetota bacterium]
MNEKNAKRREKKAKKCCFSHESSRIFTHREKTFQPSAGLKGCFLPQRKKRTPRTPRGKAVF